MDVIINFRADFKAYLLSQLIRQGYQIDPDKSLSDVAYTYFNLWRRTITPRSRIVHESSVFYCPPEYADAYQILKIKLIKGEDVSSYLSKKLLDPNYNDHLLNDFGIHHLHLGDKLDRHGFISRTNSLLFAYVMNENCFCINIFSHAAWCDKEIVNILHNDWPEIFTFYRINGIQAGDFDDENGRPMLRKCGVQMPIRFGDKLYLPLGGGITTAGTSIIATQYVLKYLCLIQNLEKYVRINM